MKTENTEVQVVESELEQCVIEAGELLLVAVCGGMDAFTNN